MVIPIQQKKEGVLERAAAIRDELTASGLRTRMDDADKSPAGSLPSRKCGEFR